ncbi:hypothetical protein D9611_004316 [Ephemerocybe angulata]|uniref:STAS domain-containing protein n=1 Tax=Ephemerocybe angulata TaxID=980116 RepID=A0A8H5BL02_9AGAR|nr:hypothetical protein D9611_004316 [Tulosesus angulatus]
MSFSRAKTSAQRYLGHPEETVPIIGSTDFAKGALGSPLVKVKDYLLSLFPIIQWLPRYNFGWLSGDVIAGLTVGMVVVPQGMSYAVIATLKPEYGLYSSFVGVLIYCFFATSKDVSIGPVAVMSLTVAEIIRDVQSVHGTRWDAPDIATALAFICGFITLGMGLLRIGWLVEFIPAPAVSGFMTGSAITIAAGQFPGLMGITGFDTRAATYKVIINSLKGLPRTKLDAAFGIVGLFFLYAIRFGCDYGSKKFPRRARMFFFISVMRNAFVIIVLTLASYLYCRHRELSPKKYPIKILLTVPSGLKHVKPPNIDRSLLSAIAGKLPVATIILLLEHIAISKSFGRLNGYKINPNQELIAIGVTNTIGSVFGAYPATGSFSRSALKSKSGVRTPAAGIITAVVVIVALYGLTAAFFWIPTAGLSAIIIHAVIDLVASPSQVYSYWRISPLEFIIWLAAVFTTIFSSVENGIYASVAASIALLLIRLAHPRDSFLGRVTVSQKDDSGPSEQRDIYLPLTKTGIVNPHVKVSPPTPGVIIYRVEESILYPNCSIVNSALVDNVKANYQRGRDMTNVSLADRPWNDTGPRRSGAEDQAENERKPRLHAIVLDLSSVSHIDTTAIQVLMDARTEIEKWADHPVEFHFAPILSPWIHRALVAGGFGVGHSSAKVHREVAVVVPYRGGRSFDAEPSTASTDDLESGDIKKVPADPSNEGSELEPLVPHNTPFFHIDLVAAVKAAESGIGRVAKN